MDRDDDPCKLFVGGLTRSTTTEHLRQYFDKFGELTDCIVIKNSATKLSRCFGFVQFTTPQIADRVVESRPHVIDGKEIDVKHASAESHERHQQQLAAAAASSSSSSHDWNRDMSPDRQKKRSRWEMHQGGDSYRNFSLPHDMITAKSNTHMAFIQRDMITYPVPLKYVREEYYPSSSSSANDNAYYPSPSRHQQNNNSNNFNNRMYQT